MMKTLELEVRTRGLKIDGVVVDIRGLNMDMGLNRTELSPDAAGGWSGRAVLPVCSRSRMEWEAQVRLRDPGAAFEWLVPFRFDTRR